MIQLQSPFCEQAKKIKSEEGSHHHHRCQSPKIIFNVTCFPSEVIFGGPTTKPSMMP